MFLKLRFLLVVALFSMLSISFVVPASHENASASDFACPGPLERPELAAAQVCRIDHSVSHIPKVPANAGQSICLFLRERVASNRDARKVVLMIHGASVPVLPGFELRKDHYDWALWLAQAGGFDVFMLDFQGSGLPPRPKMDDPCNVPSAQQGVLISNPLAMTCPPSYAFQLINSKSDWDELDAVVDYIRAIRGVDKVALVSWSQGSFRVGPYAVQHPDKVESLLLYAPLYNPAGRPGSGSDGFAAPVALPRPGTPMTLTTRDTLMKGRWDPEIGCDDQVEPGIQDVVWRAIMESDPIGRTWGPSEGVMRVRSPFVWGWNRTTAARISVPMLIIVGEFDRQVEALAPHAVDSLYNTVPGANKLLFKVQCAGHFMVWERQRRVLHHISKEWLKHCAMDKHTTEVFLVDTEGVIH